MARTIGALNRMGSLRMSAPWVFVVNSIGMHTTDAWEIATAIGTVCAVVVALAISLAQGWRDRRKAHRIRHAIAPALIGDLETVMAVLETINNAASQLLQVRMTNAREAGVVINLGKSLVVPSFDKFKDILPDLGSIVAPKVIETYGKIIRISALTHTYPPDVASLEQASGEVTTLKNGSAQLIDEIQKTIALLKCLH